MADSPIYSNIIAGVTEQIDILTENFVFQGYQSLSDALKMPLASASMLFIVLTGFGILRGAIKTPLDEFVKFSIRLGIIYFFAMNWGNFSSYMADFFIKGAGELGAVVMKTTHLAPLSMTGNSITQGLQSVFTEVIEVGTLTLKKAGLRNIGSYYTAWMIYLSGIGVVSIALFEIIVAKLMLSICLCTAPLFFIFLLFEKTRAFFDRWLGFLVGFSLVLVLVSSVLGLCMSLVHWSVARYTENHAAIINTVGWVPVFVVSALCFFAILQAASIAKHIGGACHTAGGMGMAAGLAGTAASMATFAYKKYREPSSPLLSPANHQNASNKSAGIDTIQQSLRGQP